MSDIRLVDPPGTPPRPPRRHLIDVADLTREHALDRIHGRHISTFDLLDADELREGTLRAERELPAQVEVRLEQLVVAAACVDD